MGLFMFDSYFLAIFFLFFFLTIFFFLQKPGGGGGGRGGGGGGGGGGEMAVRSRGRERTNVIIEVGGYPGKEGVRSRGENRVGADPGAVEGVDRASKTSNGGGRELETLI